MNTQDVNNQHLAAMGLSGTDLGQPYEAGADTDTRVRCSFIHPEHGVPCARTGGHEGSHARGTITWKDEPQTLAETFQQRCDEAKSEAGHEPHVYTVGEVTYSCPGHAEEIAAPTKTRPGDQRLLVAGRECIQDLVIAKMEESKRVGLERYGSTLQTFNGRRGIQDVTEEVRDLFVYLTTIEREAEADREALVQVVAEAIDKDGVDGEGFGLFDEVATKVAAIAVDAIMGWVVGQRQGGRFETADDIYVLLDQAWPVGGGRALIIESQTHAVQNLLGVPDCDDVDYGG